MLFIKTEMVADQQLVVNREGNQCGDTFTNVCRLEPLGPNERPQVEKQLIKVFENFSVSNTDEVLHLLAKRRV